MVEAKSESSHPTYELKSLEGLGEVQVPSLCEIWNWQGDTSVLPYKFESVLNAASGNGGEIDIEESGPYSHSELK